MQELGLAFARLGIAVRGQREGCAMVLMMVLAVAGSFLLTIWLCWFTLNVALDTSRSTYFEDRHNLRVNLLFGSIVAAFVAILWSVLRVKGAI
jgi:divalent metal cation (Fe/Co/Zn/Cd) transporter